MNIQNVLGVIALEASRRFGNSLNTNYRVSERGLKVTYHDDDNDIIIDITLNSKMLTDIVDSYYINYSSGWRSASYCNIFSSLLGDVTGVALAVEKLGVPYQG